jgi:hypothetical protein
MGKKSIVAVFNMDNVNEKQNITTTRTGDKELHHDLKVFLIMISI